MSRLLHPLSCLFLGGLAASASAAPKPSKAEVAEPVAEELMGGCSLQCAFSWQVMVQSEGKAKAQPAKLLNDSSAFSAWVAPAGSTGVGTRIQFLFPKKLPPGMEGQVPLYGLDLVNGNWKNEDDWKLYGRLKRARLFYNEKFLADVTFADTRRWLKVTLPDLLIHRGDTLSMEVLEIYPGTKFGLALSEFVLQGAH